MMHKLFTEIDNFNHWAEANATIPQDDRDGEWECNYEHWNVIYSSFEDFLNTTIPTDWQNQIKNQLLYIIARDNDAEHLASLVAKNESALYVLSTYAVLSGPRDAKWQLATQLYRLKDKKRALELLEEFVNDPEEYVNKRALLELAKLKSNKIEAHVT